MFKVEHEFLDAGKAKGDDIIATWGRLAIHVADMCVTRSIGLKDGSSRDGVYGPLHAVAEWFAANWWSLLYELDNGANSRTNAYQRRHDLIHAEEGYALPKLFIQARGAQVRLSSERFVHPITEREFAGMGHAVFLDRNELSNELARFIGLVIDRLNKKGVTDTRLHADWQAVSGAEAEERTFCIAAAQAGFDPYDLTDDQAKAIEKALRLPATLHEDLFALAGAGDLAQWTALVGNLLRGARTKEPETTDLKTLRRTAQRWHPIANPKPWEVGYARAERVRTHLRLNGDIFADHGQLFEAFGMDADHALLTRNWDSHALRGAVAYAEGDLPFFVVHRSANDKSQRFALGRAIHEHLFPPIQGPRMVTEVSSTAQGISRAFAAELLVPTHKLSGAIKTDVVYGDQIDDLAHKFHVESEVIRNHIINRKLARVPAAAEEMLG